ncbi:hypothetical protein PTSG_04796 [Salpingoeca rosetta]|uniref:Sulfotransferase domain-containing protein n=1 Tax=Salpingoeca rosetta (strain ATCC 50818 / BSB-021) TaxID=946362 RepID=F2U9Q5_SALR5|nr:uncharacterized protein PTSG_04796 [Salpingoeca rosetta]EGD73082.1 hypothetical protein PTSG_04796 [Salpingoeca rosetta]|eukprot:XP_004994113.1 hypothetical protein PTSG_04796 [Salpingoeca rosetta]
MVHKAGSAAAAGVQRTLLAAEEDQQQQAHTFNDDDGGGGGGGERVSKRLDRQGWEQRGKVDQEELWGAAEERRTRGRGGPSAQRSDPAQDAEHRDRRDATDVEDWTLNNDDILNDNEDKYPVSPVRPKRYWPHHDLKKDGLYPRLIGIGCQKCGTSSLAVYLGYVEGFLMSGVKEVHAFRGDHTHEQFARDPFGAGRRWMLKSMNWYQSKWNKRGLSIECDLKKFHCQGNAERDMVPFEITPRYLTDYRVPFNMWESLPSPRQMRFVVMLRNPTSRTWSAFFQTMKQRDTSRELFVAQTREELAMLHACYNSTIGLTMQDEDISAGRKPPTMNDLHLCRDPRSVYRELQTCVEKHNAHDDHPWFLHYTQFASNDEVPLNLRVQYEGLTMRGLYADQIFNFLCAGFWPEQLLIMTAGELRHDARTAVQRVTDFMGVPFQPTNEKWFDKGVSRMKKSAGPIPEDVVAELRQLFALHNRVLMRLLLNNNFNVNAPFLLKEFGLHDDPEFAQHMR